MIGLRMRLLLARGHYGVGDAVEHMIDDPVVYQVLPLIARVEAAAALVAHDSAAPSRISGLVDTLRKVRASLDDDGYLARNADAWLCLTEAELWRARGEANPQLWRQAGLRIRERTYVEHELYAALRLAEALAATGDIVHAESELAAAHQRGRSVGAIPLVEEMEALARRARLKLPGMAGLAATPSVGSLAGSARCSSWSRKAARTGRSPRHSSLARRLPACTSPTSWPSLVPQIVPKRAPKLVRWDWTNSRQGAAVTIRSAFAEQKLG